MDGFGRNVKIEQFCFRLTRSCRASHRLNRYEQVGRICSVEFVARILQELQDFLDAGLQRAFRDVMEVLERVVPTGNEKVLQWIVLILAKGCDEDQEIGLQHFANLQQHCDADSGIKFIMDRLFGLDGWSEWHNISESGEKSLIKALVLASRQKHTSPLSVIPSIPTLY